MASFVGGAGGDSFTGTEGDDVFEVGLGSNLVDGAAGLDLLRVDADLSGGTSPVYYRQPATGVSLEAGASFDLVSTQLALASSQFFISLAGLGEISSTSVERFQVDLTGSPFDDLLIWQGGTRYDGGAGTDTFFADWSATTGVTLFNDPAATQVIAVGTTLKSIERLLVVTGAGRDMVTNANTGTHDFISTGAGQDTVRGGTGNDTLDGGTGTDTVTFGGSAEPVRVDLVAGTAFGDGDDVLVSLEHVLGSNWDDVIVGNAANNYLSGMGGNDRLDGAAGVDVLSGFMGNDTLSGGPGDDLFDVHGSTGDEDLVTDLSPGDAMAANRAVLLPDADPATLAAQQMTFAAPADGRTRLYVGRDSVPGADYFVDFIGAFAASEFTMRLFISGDLRYDNAYAYEPVPPQGRSAQGGDEGDVLLGGSGNDTLRGLGGNDSLRGDGGDDLLDGGEGNDTLMAEGGRDTLQGGPGDDRLIGERQSTLEGGEGNDTLGTFTDSGLTYLYRLGTPAGLDHVELLEDDSIAFVDPADAFEVTGITVRGDPAALLAGEIALLPQADGDVLFAVGADSLAGPDITIVLEPGPLAESTAWAESFTWIASERRLFYDPVFVSTGSSLADDLYSVRGRNRMSGLEGDDSLYGGMRNDTLAGGAGDDLLAGSSGADQLSGGAGADTFVFDLPGAGDLVTDLGTGDILRLGLAGFAVTDLRDGADSSALSRGRATITPPVQGKSTLHVGLDDAPGVDLVVDVAGVVGAADFHVVNDPAGAQLHYEPSLRGMAYHWKSHALLAGVAVRLAEGPGTEPLATSGSDGRIHAAGLAEGTPMLASRDAADAASAVTSADALAALRIAAGLNPNPDPDGPGELQSRKLSPYQVIAADVNGDGKVTSADALGILRMAVKLPGAPARDWLFVDESLDLWDEAAGRSAIDRDEASWNTALQASGSARPLHLVAVQRGDVNGSWQAPAGSSDLDLVDPGYFAALATALGVPAETWGI